MNKTLALLVCLCCTAPLAAARPIKITPVTATVSVTATAPEVEKAILTAATALGWIPRAEGENQIEAKLLVRKHELIINISYTASQYTLTYKSSKNLDYNEAKQTIHSKYAQWVRNLDVRIQKELAKK
jgi:hypothetical protein